MGLILERSGMAEDLLETVGQVFGPVRGGLALAVILVGAMLAATTGVVAASVISMGLISLPIMLRYGYNRPLATGAITASGTLAQIIPPSLVLIVIADQLGRSVGDMYQAAFVPGFMLVGLYCLFIVVVAFVRPSWVPALPPEARIYREANGASGHRSLVVLLTLCVVAGVLIERNYAAIVSWLTGAAATPPEDEAVVASLSLATLLAFVIALVSRVLKLGVLSRLAEQVTFVLIPPLLLIFLVLGTIFLGIATPTEGGAMGAVGALVLAIARRRLNFSLLRQALNSTAKLSTFVLFVLIGSTIFSLTFQGIDGPKWVEHLFTSLPGGQIGFLIVVNVLIFLLGCFIDFFEIAFILLPLIGPVADKLGDRPDLVRHHRRDEPADVVPDATLRFRAVLPAQRGAERRLRRPRHRQADCEGHDRGHLQGLGRLRHDPGGDAGRRDRLPVADARCAGRTQEARHRGRHDGDPQRLGCGRRCGRQPAGGPGRRRREAGGRSGRRPVQDQGVVGRVQGRGRSGRLAVQAGRRKERSDAGKAGTGN